MTRGKGTTDRGRTTDHGRGIESINRGTTAGAWAILVGVGLAFVAAGSLIAFSLMAERATEDVLGPRQVDPIEREGRVPSLTIPRADSDAPRDRRSRPSAPVDEAEPLVAAAPIDTSPAPRVLGRRIEGGGGGGGQDPIAIPRPTPESDARFSCDPPGLGHGVAWGHCKHGPPSARGNRGGKDHNDAVREAPASTPPVKRKTKPPPPEPDDDEGDRGGSSGPPAHSHAGGASNGNGPPAHANGNGPPAHARGKSKKG